MDYITKIRLVSSGIGFLLCVAGLIYKLYEKLSGTTKKNTELKSTLAVIEKAIKLEKKNNDKNIVYSKVNFINDYFGVEIPDVLEALLQSRKIDNEEKLLNLFDNLNFNFYFQGKDSWKNYEENFFPIASMGVDGVVYGIMSIPHENNILKNILIQYEPLDDENYSIINMDFKGAINYLGYFETESCESDSEINEFIANMKSYFPFFEVNPDSEHASIDNLLQVLSDDYHCEIISGEIFFIEKKQYFENSYNYPSIQNYSLNKLANEITCLYEKKKYATVILLCKVFNEKYISEICIDKSVFEFVKEKMIDSYKSLGRFKAAERIAYAGYLEILKSQKSKIEFKLKFS
jgi:hypothetical protein